MLHVDTKPLLVIALRLKRATAADMAITPMKAAALFEFLTFATVPFPIVAPPSAEFRPVEMWLTLPSLCSRSRMIGVWETRVEVLNLVNCTEQGFRDQLRFGCRYGDGWNVKVKQVSTTTHCSRYRTKGGLVVGRTIDKSTVIRFYHRGGRPLEQSWTFLLQLKEVVSHWGLSSNGAGGQVRRTSPFVGALWQS